ncbi:hypothetical protein K437DRAFT_256005 [Tilletiaria anomala UBC 951]|uniref:Dynamin-binding protein n=1 Tax=Tilletiaria anomala (strain ATCC 24038 / CBS 436.72 / UBC 951) TaxID=1037660 RepID=A0A066W887_TILAU|nr:uncharacterized protein K437DRAFT_256005 [Tilletiaria anomala UBC 951]KDN46985.1 hypothetical protein K437DRAFT_256005 [Tilletiaria anomala UBC 951]
MSSESAPITPRSSSLVQVPIDGSVSGPTLPRRSDSIRRVLLPRCSTDSPTSPRLVSAWQQTFTSSGSSPATPGSIETGEERQLEHLNVVDGEQEMLESPSYDSPVSPPTPSEQSEKPALPKRNPLRRYAGPALASAQGSRQMGLGVVLPSPASTVGTRSVSNYVPSPQRHTAADRRVSSSDVKGEMELLRDTLREGNRSQTSLASTSVSAKDKDKDKGRRWNPLKDVFSEGEDSGHGFARSMRFRTKKASRAKDIKHFFTSEALQSGHSRSVSQMSTASTPQPEDTCLEESKEQKEARLAKMADDRTKVIRELIDTEKSYAVDLGIVRDIYLARAKSRLFAVSPTLTSSPSASAVSFGTPSISSSYFGSPLTGSGTPARQRFASSSSNRLPAKAAPQEGSSLLASPFQQRPGSPPSIDSSELSNRSSLYTVPSAISSTTSETGFTIPGSRLPSLVSDTLSPELGSASMRKSISQGTMGASQSGPINGHHHAEAPRSGSLTSQFSGLKDAPFSLSDIRIIFAGLEACASLADEMSQRLQNVVHNGDQESSSIGARLASFFIDAAPRITSTYSAYCASHTASISRLQELTTTSSKGAAFIKETTQVARQYTNAWDLASLLIKPVQRVLKYPLLLRQILKSTDPQADDYSALERALADLEALAERINEQKRRQEFIEGVVNSKFQAPSKAPGASSKSSKKLRRQHEQLKAIVGPRVNNDDILSLVGRLQNTEESVLAFSRAVSDWVKACRKAIDIQSQLMETWSDLLAKLGEEESNSSDHVEIFLALLQGELSTHWGRLDDNVHGILLPFTDTIMSMFAGPKKVVERHQQHETDYTRYQQVLSKNEKKTPDKRLVQNASEYIALHVQLLEELPQFLNGVKALVDWAVLMLANMQLDYYQKVHSEVQRFHIALKHAGTQEVVRADGFEIDEALELDLALQPLPGTSNLATPCSPPSQHLGAKFIFHSPGRETAGVNTSDHVPPGFTQLNYGSHVTMQGTEGVSPTVADRLAADSPYVDKLSLHSAEQSSSAHGSAAGQSADGAALRPSSAVTEASVKAAGSKSAPSGFRRLVRTISVSRKRLEAAPHVDQMPEVPAKDTVPSSPPLLPELPVLVPLRNTPPDSASAAAAPPSDELDSHRRRPAKLSLSSIPLLGGEDKLSDSIVTMATNVDGPEQLDFKISPVSLLPYKAGELLQVFASVPSPAAPLATTSQTHIQVAEQSQGSYVAPSQNAAEHVLARNLEGTVGWVERRCLTQVV